MNRIDVSLEVRAGLARLRLSGDFTTLDTPRLETLLGLGKCEGVPTIVDLQGVIVENAKGAQDIAGALLKCEPLGCVFPPDSTATGRALRGAFAALPRGKRPVAVATSSNARPRLTERRRAVRARVRIPVGLRWGCAYRSGWLVDVSQTGARLEVQLGDADLQDLSPLHGRAVVVEMGAGALRARVTRLISSSRGAFGVEFRDPSAAAEHITGLGETSSA